MATGYYGPQGAVRNLAETLSNRTWTPAGPPPPLGLADPNPGLYGVSCPVPGACVAVGQYDDQNSNPHGLIETLSGGTWTPANAPLPAGASADHESRLSAVACPATGTCIATGFYTGPGGYHLLGLAETTGFAS